MQSNCWNNTSGSPCEGSRNTHYRFSCAGTNASLIEKETARKEGDAGQSKSSITEHLFFSPYPGSCIAHCAIQLYTHYAKVLRMAE